MMQGLVTFVRLWTPRNMFVWMIGLAFGIPIGLVPYVNEIHRPAVVLEDLHELDGLAVRGGAIDLMARIDHRRQCSTVVTRWLWRWRDDGHGHRVQQWVGLGDPVSPPVPLGDDVRYILTIPLPATVEPGEWFYRGSAVDTCAFLPGIWSSTPRVTGDKRIEVTNPTPATPAPVNAPPGPTLVLPAPR